MDATAITFGLKDVVAIILGVISAVSFIFALVNSNKSNKAACDVNTKDLADHKVGYTSNFLALRNEVETKIAHSDQDRKTDLKAVYEEMQINKAEIKLLIHDVKQEQKEEYGKLSTQISTLYNQTNEISTKLSELTGWVKANQQNNK